MEKGHLMGDISLVSIVVPVFNTGSLIIDFIKSIIAQTYSNWELLLVDDGSDEGTLNYIESFRMDEPRIFLYKRDKQPKGSLTCRNIGMTHSKGQYIIHFDADDLVEPFCLEQRVHFMEANPSLDYAVFKGATFCLDKNSKIHLINHRWGRKRNIDDVVSFLSNDYPFSVWNCIYRSSVFKDVLWDEKVKIYTDFSYIIPTLINGYKYAYSEGSSEDYFYRVNQKNAMTSSFISNEKYESTLYLFNKTQNEIAVLQNASFYKAVFKRYFIVQLERLLNNNEKEKIINFRDFFKSFYDDRIRLNLLLFFNFLYPGKSKKITRLLVALLYRPDLIKKWILSKFHRL